MLAKVEWDSLIFEPIREMLTKIIGYLPTLLGALIILIVGWLVAKTIRGLVSRLLKAARFDQLADKAGVSEIISRLLEDKFIYLYHYPVSLILQVMALFPPTFYISLYLIKPGNFFYVWIYPEPDCSQVIKHIKLIIY